MPYDFILSPMRPSFYTLCQLVVALLLAGTCFAQTKIDTTEILSIGGIKQVVSVKGANRANPLLLFITGGPGLPGIYDDTKVFTNELEQQFVVVQWDQRNCGQTLKLNPSPVKLTVPLYEQDTHELVSQLLTQFQQKKLFLMGWSWGTVLGFYIADKYPEMLHAYLAVSPVVNQWESERIALRDLKVKAIKGHNLQAAKELSKVNVPFKDGMQSYYDRKWLTLLNGGTIEDTTAFRKYFTDNSNLIALIKEANMQNPSASLPAVRCPIYFFLGRQDYQTNYLLGERYYHALQAPTKHLFWFEKSGHAIPFTEPTLFQADVLQLYRTANPPGAGR